MKGSPRKALQHSDADHQPHAGGGSDRQISAGESPPSVHASKTRKSDPDGHGTGDGDVLKPAPGEHADTDDFKPAGDALLEPGSGVQTDHMASLADVDEFDIHQLAEEVFSSMTPDDWASTLDDYDAFEHLDLMHNGVLPGMDSSKRSTTR